jgi:hypothetical protein
LHHRHRETQSTAARKIFLRGFDRLIFNVPRKRVVEIVFLAVQIEGRGVPESVCEQMK